jgi:hypothetical protein
MPVLTVVTSYPVPNGPAVFTGVGFLSEEILMEVLLKEFERTEVCDFRCFIAKTFELPSIEEHTQ